MSDFFKKLKKKTKNNYAFVGDDENSVYSVKDYVNTGIYTLNAMLSDGDIYKGLPLGKKIVLAGQPSTAKSFFSMYIAKAWLESDPDRKVILFESEGATVDEMLETCGIDKSRFVVFPISTLEEMKIQGKQILDEIEDTPSEYGKNMIILDSLGMLSSEKEMNDSADGKTTTDMTKAKQAKAIYRILSLKLSLTQTPMITVSHVYSDMGMYAKNVTAGGQGVQYAGDVIIHLSKAQEKEGTERIGSWITMSVNKSRLMREGKKTKALILYSKGIYPYSYLLELGLEYGVITKEGNSFVFPDGQKGMKKKIMKESSTFFAGENLDKIRDAIHNDLSFGESKEVSFDDVDVDTDVDVDD